MIVDSSAHVRFPRIAQIFDGREELICVIRDSFADEVADGTISIVSGRGPTKDLALEYVKLFKEIWPQAKITHEVLQNAPSQTEALELARRFAASERPPRMIIYIGGQTVGDAAKLAVHTLRQGKFALGRQDSTKVVFGGIITSLSNDGAFSVTASVKDDDGLPLSFPTVAPDFVVGHGLTLLRQPYEMKISCVADLLAKPSSLWDYTYGSAKLKKYRNTFAADLTIAAYQIVQNDEMSSEYLKSPQSTYDLFRPVQLCGLSMQLAQSSEPCSGAEHVGQKFLDEFITRYNKVPRQVRLQPLTHGQAVLPMALITLHLQGQARVANEIKKTAARIGLKFTAQDLGISPTIIQACLVLGLGYRCPAYAAHLLADQRRPVGLASERVTILEEIETQVLPRTIQNAMIDAGVALSTEFGGLSGVESVVMDKVLESAKRNLERGLRGRKFDESTIAEVIEKFSLLVGRFLANQEAA